MVHSLLCAASRLLTASRAHAGMCACACACVHVCVCVCECVRGLDAGRVQLSLCVPFDRRHMISVNSSHRPCRRTFLNKSFRSGNRKYDNTYVRVYTYIKISPAELTHVLSTLFRRFFDIRLFGPLGKRAGGLPASERERKKNLSRGICTPIT